MAVLKNRAKMSTSTTGTGTITLGSAEDGYQTFADAGVANGDVVRYVIEDGSNWEIGTGTYTATGTTLSRTVSESSNSDAAINLSGSATVFIGATAEDIPALYAENYDGTSTLPSATGTNAVAIGSSSSANSSASIALGDSALSFGSDTLVLQKGRASGSQATSIAVHNNSSAYGSNHLGAVSIGSHAKSTQDYSFALGHYSQANANYAMAFGRLANAGHISSVAIGHNAATTSANQIALGSTSDTVKISGTYTLPTADGSANQVLTTDGSGAVTFADAGGGGGADLYAANESSPSAQPSATGTNAVAIGDSAVASGANALAGPFSQASGTGSFAAAINSTSTSWGAKGTYGVALGYEARADTSTTGAVAIGYEADSRGNFGVAIGPDAYVTTNGTRAIAIGYQAEAGAAQSFAAGDAATISSSGTSAVALGTSYANAQDAFSAAIANNTSSYGATGANSIAGGDYNKATATDSLCWGGDSNVAQSGAKSAVVGGWQNNCSGAYSFISGGRGNKITSGSYSRAGGLQADVNGTGIDTWSSGRFSSDGDAQTSKRVLIANTTDATATVLGTQNINSLAANQVTLPNNSAFAFHGTIVARQQAADGTACAAWKVEGLIRREGSAGTTVLVNSATTVLDNTPSWGMALSADTSLGCLKIQVTGAASTDIRWVATIHTSEVTYA